MRDIHKPGPAADSHQNKFLVGGEKKQKQKKRRFNFHDNK